jgi:arylsulfatase A
LFIEVNVSEAGKGNFPEYIMMKRTVLLTAILLSISGFLYAAAEKPNVILIMADDLAYGDLSCYGSDKQKTPVLDKLAGEGMRLTNYFSGNTVCTPSRMALLTGAYPARLGWTGGVVGYGLKTENGLSPKALTIAEIFKGEGYKTAISGKWHLGDTPELSPMNQGFDSCYYINKSNNQTKDLWRDGVLVEKFKNPLLSEQFTREAVTFITANKDHPFFLYVPYTAPHFPAQAHPDWKGTSDNVAFGDVVEELDFRVGQILAALKETGIDKKTLVVFTSDNGTDGTPRKWGAVKPFRGIKWSSREGGSRVPCMFYWPGVVPAGQESAKLTAAIDLLPTLCRAVGIDAFKVSKGVPKIDGMNVWDTMIGNPDAKHPRNDLLMWDGWAKLQAIRVGEWKLYFDRVKDIRDSGKGLVLIDLADDIIEMKNVSDQHPERVKKMLALAKKQIAEIQENSIPLGGPDAQKKKKPESAWLK